MKISYPAFWTRYSSDRRGELARAAAAAVALTRRISVISGGPGTGVHYRREAAGGINSNGGWRMRCRIRLAAPIGKAAVSPDGVARRRCVSFTYRCAEKKRIPEDASTRNRLLGAYSPAASDYIISNLAASGRAGGREASMIDLPMMSRLIDALPPHGRVILAIAISWHPLRRALCWAIFLRLCQRRFTAERARQLSTNRELFRRGPNASRALPASVCAAKVTVSGSDFGIGKLAAAINCGDRSAIQSVFRKQGLAI